MGANVLHEDAVFPRKTGWYPHQYKNTNEPEAAGTLIVPNGGITPGAV